MKKLRSLAVCVSLLGFLSTPALGQQPSIQDLREEVRQEVISLAKLTQEIVDMVYSFSELGFQEIWTADYLTGILRQEGFEVERGAAGMPTNYVATWGSGNPVVGFMGDFDGLPETNQKPGVPWQEALVPGGPGHGEGHNTTPAVDITAAIAVKRVMERHGLEGTLKVIPGVAEELVASRTYMVMAGLFEDMDVMLSTHVSNRMTTGWGVSGSGLVSTQFTFHGRTAHGAGSPWSGRSALDAVELMNIGWNFRREHLRRANTRPCLAARDDDRAAPCGRRGCHRRPETGIRLFWQGAGRHPRVGDRMVRENLGRKAGMLFSEILACVNARVSA